MAEDLTKQNAKEAAAAKAKQSAATQAYLNIAEIKDGVLVLKDGSMRAVLMTSSVNFALKSAAEQDGIIYAYQRFLNSLSFPIQILVQSRRLDLDYYLEKLKRRADEQNQELVKLQILEYSEFINRLISVTNIMDKRFYVIVPFFPPGTEAVKGFGRLFSTGSGKKAEAKQRDETFERGKVQLMQRVEAIASGLGGLGVRAVTLNSEELVELFYSAYNPGTSTKQRLVNADELTASTIKRADTVHQTAAAPVVGSAMPVPDNEVPASSEPTEDIEDNMGEGT